MTDNRPSTAPTIEMPTIQEIWPEPIWSDLGSGEIIPEIDALDKLSELATEAKGERRNFPARDRDQLAQLGVKRCAGCSRVMPRDSFSRSSKSSDGLDSSCKPCNVRRVQEQNQRDPEAAKARGRIAQAKYRNKAENRLKEQLDRGYRRAISYGVTAHNITPEELLSYWESVGIDPLVSVYSGTELTEVAGTEEPRSLDHTRSMADGGGHVLENLVPCTRAENENKSKTHFINIITKKG